MQMTKVAVITGASAGIGAATADALARDGYQLILGARRLDKLQDVAKRTKATALEVDVRDPHSVERFAAAALKAHPKIGVLINNAGLALSSDNVETADDEDWVRMWETNVLGLMRVTRAFIPALRASGLGHVVNIGSVAGFDNYKGGSGYTSTKHAVRAITQTLRLELNGEPIRVSEVAPGMTDTEFAIVRFKGDAKKASGVYEGITPMTPADIAECVAFVVGRPPHVNIDFLVARPLAQATSYLVARNKPGMP